MRPVPVNDPGQSLRNQNDELLDLVRAPWTLRVGSTPMIVRPSTVRDLPAVAQMHGRCSPRSLLDRYRAGGRPPAVAALDAALRNQFSVVVALADGSVVAVGALTPDRAHNHLSAEIGLLVQDAWQRLGIGTELVTHLAGVAQVAGYHEIIAYPATAVHAGAAADDRGRPHPDGARRRPAPAHVPARVGHARARLGAPAARRLTGRGRVRSGPPPTTGR